MSFDPRRAAATLERQLRASGGPERAVAEKRYLKSDLRFFGASMGDIRRVVNGFVQKAAGLDHRDLTALVTELWSKPVFERRMAAVVLLDSQRRLLTNEDLGLIERLIRESKTWALVDVLAVHVSGDIVLRDGGAFRTLDRWARDDDFWIRRSALLAHLEPLKQGGDFARFAGYADRMLD